VVSGNEALSVTRQLIAVALLLAPLTGVPAEDVHGRPGTAVPAWDARGPLKLPWQGIACIDTSDDGRWIALGTIAPAGDPNVFLLDSDGKLVRTAQVGQRWLQQVAVDRSGKVIHALCTMPEGRASDFPTVYTCADKSTAIPPHLGEDGWPGNLFHYGDHSNHVGVQLRGFARGGVAVYGDRVLWLTSTDGKPEQQIGFSRPSDGVTVALAIGAAGHALVGCAAHGADDRRGEHNLFLLAPGSRKPSWSRPVLKYTDKGRRPEKGIYGSPTLPDGKREELPQKDDPVFAPLSLALYGRDAPELIATADYPGWQRWVRSSATLRQQNYGARFLPARPTVSIYDGKGRLLRRFGHELFPRPAWVDLCFAAGGKYLLAYPHHWTCRGLAGQPVLPADDDARTLFVLEIATGKVRALKFPDAISHVSAGDSGPVIAGCWNGRFYILDEEHLLKGKLPTGNDCGGPSLVRASRDGKRLVVASTAGEVRLVDPAGRELWRRDLNRLVKPAPKPWVESARALPLGPGVWQLPSHRVESDFGGQRVIEAPGGLILIEGHAGLSFDREWQGMKAVGLDPRRVKYVLATHEHGDHAPGAYLWRLATGARFVCSKEMAYTLQHHLPLGTGYGLHPPVPTDFRVTKDTELDLAGLKVQALRLPGHTAGSMGWFFRKEKRSYVAFGDLIMPEGVLGYSGSINFSGRDALASLRELRDLRPDFALPGHGPTGDPSRYIQSGIDVGVHVGWGKFRPEKPDPYFRLTQKNVQVVAWNQDIVSADFGDIDGDGQPDVAVVAPDGDGAVVKLFLNHAGSFREEADQQIRLPRLTDPNKIRLRRLRDGKIADIVVAGRSSVALLLSKGKLREYEIAYLPLGDVHQAHAADLAGTGSKQILVGSRFGGFQVATPLPGGKFDLRPAKPEITGPYADFRHLDLNGDARRDLITSSGKVYLRGADGRLPAKPTMELERPDTNDWTFLAVGDFNADGRPDVVLLSYGMQRPRLSVFYNTGERNRPFKENPDKSFDLSVADGKKTPPTLLRDSPVVADWNGDGVPDLIVARGQDNQVTILLGGKKGLDPGRATTVKLDYRIHYETGLYADDFDGDGMMDLACLGYTSTGVGAGGPLAVYIWRQQGK
jgi:glyoxylase-like metal-dependent hydrolase (beta-lactamase superfamily II)